MFSAELGMVVSRPCWFPVFWLRLDLFPWDSSCSCNSFPLGVIVFPRGVVGFHGDATWDCCRGPGWILFGAWLVPIPEVLAGRRLMVRPRAGWWISFIRGPRPGGGVPARLAYHLVGRR